MDQDINQALANEMDMLDPLDFNGGIDLGTASSTVLVNSAPVQQVTQNMTNNTVAAQVVTPSQTTFNTPVQNNSVYAAPVQKTVNDTPMVDLDAAPVFVRVSKENTTQSDFLKLKEGEATRVALANYDAIQTRFHYEQGLGYFKCLSKYEDEVEYPISKGICCLQLTQNDKSKIIGKGKKKMFLPVVEYPVSHTDGKGVIPGAKPKLKILALNIKEWEAIVGCEEAYPDAKAVDLFIKRRRDSSSYLTFAIMPMPTVRAEFNGAVEAEIAKITNRTYNLAVEEFSKTLSEARVTKFYEDKAKQELAISQMQNQPIPTPEGAGISGQTDIFIPMG